MAAGKQRSPHSKGCQWLLMLGGEVRGWRCTWLDWREERAWLGQAMWSEALLGSCWEAKDEGGRWVLMPGPQGEGGRWVLMPGGGRGV